MFKKLLVLVLIGSMLHGGPGAESSESDVKKSRDVRKRLIVEDLIEGPSRMEMEKSEKLPNERSPSNDDGCLTLCCKLFCLRPGSNREMKYTMEKVLFLRMGEPLNFHAHSLR